MTWRSKNTVVKGGTYHISSHLGNTFPDRNPNFQRIDYVRDSFVGGIPQKLNDDVSVYGEVEYTYGIQPGAAPPEVQFGSQYAFT